MRPACVSAQTSIVDRDRDVQGGAPPHRSRLQAQGPEHDAPDDRGERLGHRLAVVQHVVRQRHREDRGPTQPGREPVQEKAAEEELQRAELEPVEQPPRVQVRPERVTGRRMEERIPVLERCRERRGDDQGRGDGVQDGVHAQVRQDPLHAQPVVAHVLAQHEPDHEQRRDARTTRSRRPPRTRAGSSRGASTRACRRAAATRGSPTRRCAGSSRAIGANCRRTGNSRT